MYFKETISIQQLTRNVEKMIKHEVPCVRVIKATDCTQPRKYGSRKLKIDDKTKK